MSTILVTGAAGFIGSHTSEAFLKRGDEVIGIDNLNDYYNPAWKQENLDTLQQYEKFSFQKADILDLSTLEEIFAKHQPEKILHLAARAGVRPSIEQPFLYEEVNVRGTLYLLELSRRTSVRHFVMASSSSVYGNQTKIPFSEDDPVNNPISPYAASKKAAEMYGHTYASLYNLSVTALRFFTVYGERGRPDMAPYLFTKAVLTGQPIRKFGDGKTSRDYTYIADIVDGILRASDHEHKGYEVFNLGNNTPVSLNEFIATLEKITGKQAIIQQEEMQPGDVEKTYADIEKAKSLLGYTPRTSFSQGLSKFVSWYKENRVESV